MAKIKFTKETYNGVKNDAKKLWSLINFSIGRNTKRGDSIPKFFRDNDKIFENFEEIANGFNDFFINIGQKLQDKIPKTNKTIHDFLGNKVPFSFEFIFVDKFDVIAACSKLKPKSSQGLDILSNKIIKILFPKIPILVSKLINLTFIHGIVPPS